MITGVLLSGGQSRRFGSPKAFASYQDKPFYVHALSNLQLVADRQVIVSSPALQEKFPSDAPVIKDTAPFQGKGPLAGIFSAMRHLTSDWYIVLPCDMPFVRCNTLKRLANLSKNSHDQAIVPIVANRSQPLVAMYHYSCMEKIFVNLQNGYYAVQDLLDKINVKYVDENKLDATPDEFQNINTLEDYAHYMAKEDL